MSIEVKLKRKYKEVPETPVLEGKEQLMDLFINEEDNIELWIRSNRKAPDTLTMLLYGFADGPTKEEKEKA
jgi:hypothetical protein